MFVLNIVESLLIIYLVSALKKFYIDLSALRVSVINQFVSANGGLADE